MTPIYMDHNASSPLRAEVIDAMNLAFAAGGNPSSVHGMGRRARRLVEDAREQVRSAVNAPKSAQVIFTSGGTEANALVLKGTGRHKIMTTRTEHPSVLQVAQNLDHLSVDYMTVDHNGLIDPFAIEQKFSGGGDDVLVSTMLAHNETGVLQEVAGIATIAHRFDALMHTDAVQGLGKVAIDFERLGVDYLSLSAHKIGGPQGVGALIKAAGAPLAPMQPGGGQEGGLRGGTENVAGIAGFGAAITLATTELAHMDRVQKMRDDLEAEILTLAPDAMVLAKGAGRLPNTSMIIMPDVPSDTQIMTFDLAGICVSAGSACASGKTKSSGALGAMGLAPDLAKCAVRVSLSHTNTEKEIKSFFSAWKDLYQRQADKRNAA